MSSLLDGTIKTLKLQDRSMQDKRVFIIKTDFVIVHIVLNYT